MRARPYVYVCVHLSMIYVRIICTREEDGSTRVCSEAIIFHYDTILKAGVDQATNLLFLFLVNQREQTLNMTH